MDIQLGTVFVDPFIRGIVLAEWKIVPQNTQPVAIVGIKTRNTEENMVDESIPKVKVAKKVLKDGKEISVVFSAHQIVLKPNMQHGYVLATKSSGFLAIGHIVLQTRRQCALAARGRMDFFPERPLHIFVSNFFNRDVHLPENMKTTQMANPPSAVHKVDTVDYNITSIGTPEADVNTIASEVSALSQVEY